MAFKLDEFRLEIQRRDQEILAMAAKMKTLEEQHQVKDRLYIFCSAYKAMFTETPHKFNSLVMIFGTSVQMSNTRNKSIWYDQFLEQLICCNQI